MGTPRYGVDELHLDATQWETNKAKITLNTINDGIIIL